MPFCGHEQCSFLGWSFSVHGLRPVNLGHKFVVDFTKSRSCQLCCGSDRWIGLCCDSLPWKLRTRNPARTHSPLKSTWSWVPSDTCACAEIAHYSHLQHANELGECHLEQRKHLRDENFMGDRGHFYVTHTSWGSRVAFLRLKKLRWVILGPRRIFSKYCPHTVCTRYSVMSLLLHVITGTD